MLSDNVDGNDNSILFNMWINLTDGVVNNQLVLVDKQKIRDLHSADPLTVHATHLI